MISIIAGKFKGRKLHDIKKLHVRPTQAKVRKSIFQILEPFHNLKVLDLYAGVGTLGIEAISRGASNVVFVEKNYHVYKLLKKNLQLIDVENYDVILSDSIRFVNGLRNTSFDIVFADPPYAKVKFDLIKSKVDKILKPDGVFCMEMKKEIINTPNVRIKYYGNSQVVFSKQ